MTHLQAVRDVLLASPTVASLVDTRIYPTVAPQGVARPFVVLTLVSEKVWEQDPNLYQVVYGALIILVVLFMPGGLVSLLQNRNILPRSRRI